LEILTDIADGLELSLSDAINLPDLDSRVLKTNVLKRLILFRDDINDFFRRSQTEDCYRFACDVVVKYGLLTKYKTQNDIESLARAGNVEELLNWIGGVSERIKYERMDELYASGEIQDGVELTLNDISAVTIGEFLEDASLLSAVDVGEDENKVQLMTIHASKGLEFPHVYVVGMEENIFPSGGWMASETEIEEERRLFYVAMTRAKKTLDLSFAASRFRNGKTESNSPSRFVKEIDAQYVANPLVADREDDDEPKRGFGGWGQRTSAKAKFGGGGYSYGNSGPVRTERPSQPVRKTEPTPVRRPQVVVKRVSDAEFEPTPILQLKAGQRIEHNRFGFGNILEITGTIPDLKAKIAFDDHGEKILLLKYAKIRVV
jgi:DNA helicase-2/ATP-dependent DNA helicase PcrA